MTAVALSYINHKNFLRHDYLSPATQALNRRPEAGSYSLLNASGYSVIHSSICFRATFSTSARNPLVACPAQCLETIASGTIVLLAPPRSSLLGMMKTALGP